MNLVNLMVEMQAAVDAACSVGLAPAIYTGWHSAAYAADVEKGRDPVAYANAHIAGMEGVLREAGGLDAFRAASEAFRAWESASQEVPLHRGPTASGSDWDPWKDGGRDRDGYQVKGGR